MLASCDFIDLGSVGGLFTWRKNTTNGGHVRKRLDRGLADVSWRLIFPHALVETLPSSHSSDHNPLLLSCLKSSSRRSKLFHFQAAWISHPDYELLVTNSWRQTQGAVPLKLSRVRDDSIQFNKEIFGNIFKRKRELEARINGIHRQLDTYPSSDLIRLART